MYISFTWANKKSGGEGRGTLLICNCYWFNSSYAQKGRPPSARPTTNFDIWLPDLAMICMICRSNRFGLNAS